MIILIILIMLIIIIIILILLIIISIITTTIITKRTPVAGVSPTTFPQFHISLDIQCESKLKSPLGGPDIFHFFHKRLRIFNRFFTHLLYVLIYARLQIFIQLSPILTKLCHIKRDYAVRSSHNMLKISTTGRNACIDMFA